MPAPASSGFNGYASPEADQCAGVGNKQRTARGLFSGDVTFMYWPLICRPPGHCKGRASH
jgi:hypothetical protein